jgi:hypothetical protein
MLKNITRFKTEHMLIFLLAFDKILAVRHFLVEKCKLCGAALHSANYRRKNTVPSGWEAPDGFDLVHASCCSNPQCRTRKPIQSVRFAPHKHGCSFIRVIIQALSKQLTENKMCKIASQMGVSPSTLRRMRVEWATFSTNKAWKKISIRHPYVVNLEELVKNFLSSEICVVIETLLFTWEFFLES